MLLQLTADYDQKNYLKKQNQKQRSICFFLKILNFCMKIALCERLLLHQLGLLVMFETVLYEITLSDTDTKLMRK